MTWCQWCLFVALVSFLCILLIEFKLILRPPEDPVPWWIGQNVGWLGALFWLLMSALFRVLGV